MALRPAETTHRPRHESPEAGANESGWGCPVPPPAKRRRGPPPVPQTRRGGRHQGAAEFPPEAGAFGNSREQDDFGRGPSSPHRRGPPRDRGGPPEGPAAKRRGEAQGLPSPALGRRRADPRGAAGTWEGAERCGVGAQRPVAHPRHQLQAEDLLQEPGRRPAAAAPLAFHPAAIHRRGLRESARGAAEGRAPEMLPQRELAYGLLRSPHLRSHSVTFGRGPLPPTPTALPSDGSFLQLQGAADGRGGARGVPAPDVAYGSRRPGPLRPTPPTGEVVPAPVGRARLCPSLQRHLEERSGITYR